MNVLEVALVGRSYAGMWALPKGTPQPGETIEQVAVREAQEETGLQVRLVAYIGSISYSFVRDSVRYHKQVRHTYWKLLAGIRLCMTMNMMWCNGFLCMRRVGISPIKTKYTFSIKQRTCCTPGWSSNTEKEANKDKDL